MSMHGTDFESLIYVRLAFPLSWPLWVQVPTGRDLLEDVQPPKAGEAGGSQGHAAYLLHSAQVEHAGDCHAAAAALHQYFDYHGQGANQQPALAGQQLSPALGRPGVTSCRMELLWPRLTCTCLRLWSPAWLYQHSR